MMNQNKFTTLKNFIWAGGIVVCLTFVAIGLLFAMFHRYNMPDQDYNPNITGTASSSSDNKAPDLSSSALGSGNARGLLNILERTDDAGEEYVNSLIFLVDSTYIGLRDLGLVGSNQVWGTVSGSMRMANLPSTLIRFPNDGSEISPASAAMVSKPATILIAIGMDGLADVDENTFITHYDNLISEIKSASPGSTIICCGLPSVIPGYTGSDGLNLGLVSDGNDWVQLVCRDTGAYFLNVQEALSEGVQLLTRFAASNGKTLNRSGLEEFLGYVRTHALP